MDDNHRLLEWLAYHYYSLNLRSIIVAVDPSSSESPSVVLNRWKHLLEFEVWNDGDYMDPILFARKEGETKKQIVKKHRHRQNAFYNACIRRLRETNRSWTAFIDPDEYVTLNLAYNTSNTFQNLFNTWESLSTTPGLVEDAIIESNKLVSLQPNHTLRHHFGKDCIILPRTWYSSAESNSTNIQGMLPKFIDARRFDTLRWTHRATSGQVKKLGKCIINVSKITDEHLRGKGNAHRPLFNACTSNPYVRYDDSPVVIHHYLGSWEQYNYRNDSRNELERSYEVWQKQGKSVVSTTDDIRSWINGFVGQVGETEAERLLQGTGLPYTKAS